VKIDFEKMKKMPWFASYPEQVSQALENQTLPVIPVNRFLESSAKYYPHSVALIYEPENFIVTYSELLDLSRRFASGLQYKFRVKKGDRVAIYARNCPEIAIAIWGIFAAGATYVTCNPLLIKKEVQYQLNDTEARIIIVSDDKLPTVMELMEEGLTAIESVIVFAWEKELKPKFLGSAERDFSSPYIPYAEVFCRQPLEKPEIDPHQDLSTIMYTSGTTSYPKGVMVSHYNAVSAAILYGTVTSGCFPEQDRQGFLRFSNQPKDLSENWDFPLRYGIDNVISIQPWTHMMGFMGQLIYPIMSALTIVQLPAFTQDAMLSMIQRYKIAFAGGAPMLMVSLLSRPDIASQDISCIRYWTTGGAPTAVTLAEQFEKKISGVISEAWALTETTMVSTKNYANRSGRRKYGSVGIPLPFTSVKVVDMQTGKTEMPTGEEGELIQKGPTVALGYYNLAEDTQAAFKDGWLYTGDLGWMDD
jgi:long-chain acyl-CoA synthetase